METRSIDTNVLIRGALKGKTKQHRKARRVFQEHTIYITDTVLLESFWVLRNVHEMDLNEIYDCFKKLTRLRNADIESRSALIRAIKLAEAGLGFADAFHLAKSRPYEMVTFDQKFAKRGKREGEAIALL